MTIHLPTNHCPFDQEILHIPMEQNLVGPVVRKLRMEAGLSQEALAARLQVAGWDLSRGGLSKIEARLRRVNDAEVLVLARVPGCQVDAAEWPSIVAGFRASRSCCRASVVATVTCAEEHCRVSDG